MEETILKKCYVENTFKLSVSDLGHSVLGRMVKSGQEKLETRAFITDCISLIILDVLIEKVDGGFKLQITYKKDEKSHEARQIIKMVGRRTKYGLRYYFERHGQLYSVLYLRPGVGYFGDRKTLNLVYKKQYLDKQSLAGKRCYFIEDKIRFEYLKRRVRTVSYAGKYTRRAVKVMDLAKRLSEQYGCVIGRA